ncbi:MAG: alpha/beta hydrolase [Sandaracinaceae bacterium]|nr:alpha/beta hydrolase [Sandaracinaceae bacterium]
MKPVKVEEQRVASFDGTDLAYHVVGRARPSSWRTASAGAGRPGPTRSPTSRTGTASSRGTTAALYRSGPPPARDDLRVEDHARDALRVMDDAGIEQTAIFGWSMGVQVALEVFRRAPDRVKLLVLINGVAGRPWESAFNVPQLGAMIPTILGAVRMIPGVAQSVTERVVQWPETVTWAKRVGLAGQTLDEDIFAQLAGSFAQLDMDLYVHTLELLGEHDARDCLDELDVPVLVISGDRDLFTPRRAAEDMVHRVRGAELLVVPGGTHYVAVEYPELVNLRVEKFFRERGYVRE